MTTFINQRYEAKVVYRGANSSRGGEITYWKDYHAFGPGAVLDQVEKEFIRDEKGGHLIKITVEVKKNKF